MTCDERLEQLLNRCGQTITDLPKDYLDTSCILAFAGVQEWQSENKLSTQHICEKYILHLTDIIDRLEWALENVCGERDYLRTVVCGLCTNFHEDGADACETCIVGDGVPEYWRADDEKGL